MRMRGKSLVEPTNWNEWPCLGCKAPLNSPDMSQRLCAECNWRGSLWLAHIILGEKIGDSDDSLDPVRMDAYGKMEKAFWLLAAGWDWSREEAVYMAQAIEREIVRLERKRR
jgi:hypothetical protein